MTCLIIWLWITCIHLALVDSSVLTQTSTRIRTISQSANTKNDEGQEERVMGDAVSVIKGIRGGYNHVESEKKIEEELWHEKFLNWIKFDERVYEFLKIQRSEDSQLNIFTDTSLILVAKYLQLYNKRTNSNKTLLDLLLTFLTEETLLEKLSKVLQLKDPPNNTKQVTKQLMAEILKSWHSQKLSGDDVFVKLKLSSSIDAIMFQRGYRQLLDTYMHHNLPESDNNPVLDLLIKHFGEGAVAESLACWKFANSHYVAFRFNARRYATEFTQYDAEMASIFAKTNLHILLQRWERSRLRITSVIRLLKEANDHSVLSNYKLEVLREYIRILRVKNIDQSLLTGFRKIYGVGYNFAMELQNALRNSKVNASTLKNLKTNLYAYWVKRNITPMNIRELKFRTQTMDDDANAIVAEFITFYNSIPKNRNRR